jgi:hypothetical protein
MAIGHVFDFDDFAQSHDATLMPGRKGSVLVKI